MEKRNLNIIYTKSGAGNKCTKITLPIPWVRALGATPENKLVEVSFDGEKIIKSYD